MSVETTASEQMLKYSWGGAKVTLRITGKGAGRLLALFKAKWDSRMPDGKVNLHKLHSSTQAARVISAPSASLVQFDQLCRKYNIMYASITDRQTPERADIMVRGEDVAVVNRIFEECGVLDNIEEVGRVETVSREEITKGARREKTGKSEIAEERPQSARAQGAPSACVLNPSKSVSEDRPSVRTQLKEITESLKKIKRARGREHAPISR